MLALLPEATVLCRLTGAVLDDGLHNNRLIADFILTWPFNPREGDRKITKTDRKVVMLLIVLSDLVPPSIHSRPAMPSWRAAFSCTAALFHALPVCESHVF